MESDTIQGLRTYAVLQNAYSPERAKAAMRPSDPILAPAILMTQPRRTKFRRFASV